MLDVRRLRVLREVAACGSFSGAADALSFTQSAVSQQMAALEREAGASLVERGARGVRLTDAGRALVRHADAVLARLDDAEQELAAIAGLRGGRLRLASFQSAGAALVPDAVRAFSERYPDVELGLREAEPQESLVALKAGECDLALVYAYPALRQEPDGDVDLVRLLEDKMHAALPRDHRLAARARVRMEQLSGDAWISGDLACGRLLRHACDAAGFDPRVRLETSDYATMQGLVAAGVGVTLLPDLVLATGTNPGVVVRPLAGEAPTRTIWAATPAGGYRSAAVEAMLGILEEVCSGFEERLAPAASVG